MKSPAQSGSRKNLISRDGRFSAGCERRPGCALPKLELQPFTLVVRPLVQVADQPLRDRFGIWRLEFGVDELSEIVTRSAIADLLLRQQAQPNINVRWYRVSVTIDVACGLKVRRWCGHGC